MEALRFRRTSIHGSRSGAATSYRALRAHNHGEVDATHIIVDVKNGEVTLTGTVEDRRTKRLAEDAVETVTG
ncbi:MAG: BON domain-containing protein, partial [Kofleriaceae bacterium]